MSNSNNNQGIKELIELVEKIQNKAQGLKQENLRLKEKMLKLELTGKCWAGVLMDECPYQSIGDLDLVNPYYCSICYLIRHKMENLFSKIEEIFGSEISKNVKSAVDETIEQEQKEAKEETEEKVKSEYEEKLENLIEGLKEVLEDMENDGED